LYACLISPMYAAYLTLFTHTALIILIESSEE
jgi:hypothetical protein